MIQAIRGTKDILPDAIDNWLLLEETAKKVCDSFGYKQIRTPIFEKTEVFSRGVGEGTDIVNKEMYTFLDKGGESVTLRPEMTAALVRAVVQSTVYLQQATTKLWYFGPFFRYERPQKGRLRQFHQFGAECISSPYPESDVEIISLAADYCRSLGIGDYKLLVNSLGNEASRQAYRKVLTDYLFDLKNELSPDSQARLEQNPLRVLDSKAEQDKTAVENSPNIIDSLDAESKEHFDKVLELLQGLGIEYTLSPRLVRGLDYYSHTVFEFQHNALGSQDSFGGGGRYNDLFNQLGGKPTPAVGFAMGVERLLLILESLDKLPNPQILADYYVLSGETKFIPEAQKIAANLRRQGHKVLTDLHHRSFKSQMKEANNLNIPQVVIIAEEELSRNVVKIKNMTTGEQKEIALSDDFSLLALD